MFTLGVERENTSCNMEKLCHEWKNFLTSISFSQKNFHSSLRSEWKLFFFEKEIVGWKFFRSRQNFSTLQEYIFPFGHGRLAVFLYCYFSGSLAWLSIFWSPAAQEWREWRHSWAAVSEIASQLSPRLLDKFYYVPTNSKSLSPTGIRTRAAWMGPWCCNNYTIRAWWKEDNLLVFINV